MSKRSIIVLMSHRHTLLDPIYKFQFEFDIAQALRR
jgi:hypothetical protein